MPMRNSSKNSVYTVQALRTFAALMVVLYHCIALWLGRICHQPGATFWMNGAAGVDIFFVISGFVMALSLDGLFKHANPIRVFLQRRVTRIVPLYWIATTLKVALLIVVPGVAVHQGLRLANVIGSYLFWPVANPEGLMLPVVVEGWTLSFEMLFYLMFSLAMLFKRWTLALLAVLLISVASIGSTFSLQSALLLEFLFGVVIARMAMASRLPSTLCSWILLGGGLAATLTLFPNLPSETVHAKWRFFLWGVPAAIFVLGAVGLESAIGEKIPKWLISLGNASYGIYLIQAFVLPCVAIATVHLGLHGRSALVLCIAAGILLSAVAGEVVHRFVEIPILRRLKNSQQRGVGTAT